MKTLRLALLVVVSLALAATGVLKLITEHTAEIALPKFVYYSVAVSELAAAALLYTRYSTRVLVASVFLIAGGALCTLFLPPSTSCGCLGFLSGVVSQRGKIAWTAALGMAVSGLLILNNPKGAIIESCAKRPTSS